MSWRHRLLLIGRHLWRVLLWLLLLVVLLVVAVLAVLGSETGSRWLLERGLGMQQTLDARYSSGTWLGGLELEEVRVQAGKTRLDIRHVMARWTVWQLLRGRLEVASLRLEGVELRRLAPPSDQPTDLPTLVLPVRLVVREAVATDIRFWRWGAAEPLTLRRLELGEGRWTATRVRFGHLALEQERIGRLELAGRIRLRGDYPLEAAGRLDYLPFREQGWAPVQVRLDGSVALLDVGLSSSGGLNASAQGRLQPLAQALPFEARLQWQQVVLPWWSDQSLRSEGGELRAKGNRDGLEAEGRAQLAGRHLPAGRYTVRGTTDWRSARIGRLEFEGLGGRLQARGELDWRTGLKWHLQSELQGIDLARKWPVPKEVVPVVTGTLTSTGHTSSAMSDIVATLRLAGGESWELVQQGRAWPWRLEIPQRAWLRWSGVRRRLPGDRQLYSAGGELRGEGSLADYRLESALRLDGMGVPAGQWSLAVAGRERRLEVSRLDYAGDAGRLGFQGLLDLTGPVAWRGDFVLDDAATGWLLPDWSGQFDGRLSGYGSWGPARRDFVFERAQLAGALRGQSLRLEGPLEVTLVPGEWPALHSAGLQMEWGANRAALIGGLREGRWDLAAEADLGELHLLYPELAGRLRGQVALQGPARRPDVQADLAGDALAFRGWQADVARLEGAVAALGDGSSRLSLDGAGVSLPGGRELGEVQATLAGTREAHALDWRVAGAEVAGGGRFAGGLAAPGWSGALERGEVVLRGLQWTLEQSFAIDWRQDERELRLATHCWTADQARLCNEEEMRLGATGRVRVALDGLRLEQLGAFLPEGLLAEGRVDGAVAGDWAAGERPVLKASLAAGQGVLRLQREDARRSLPLAFERIALVAEAGARSVDLRFDLVSGDIGQGHVQARIDPFGERRPLQGELSLQGLRLEIFQPFLPGIGTLAGTLTAEGRLAGVLAKPDFHGVVRLQDGEVAFQRLPLHMRDITGRIDVQGTSAELRGTVRSGEGGATLQGSADWSETPVLEMTLRGRRFQLRQPPELMAEVDPDLRLRVLPGRADLNGTIRVPTARLNLKPLTDQAVPLSPDVRVVRAEDRERLEAVARVAAWEINADIRLLLGDDVYFHGYGVNGRLLGGLRLRQEGRRGLEANGEVELDREARYDAYGQRLEIRRGRLIFAGNLTQPGLDVEAIREVDGKVVGVKVQGRANAPEAALFSDTPMSQEEIVSYLVLGRPLEGSAREGGSGGNMAAAAAAIKLGATGGAGLTSRVGETFGITDFTVDAEGSGDDTQFTVSGYLSPKLYLRYGVGIFTPVNTATLRYRINSRLYLEAVSSLESAIDLFYNWRF